MDPSPVLRRRDLSAIKALIGAEHRTSVYAGEFLRSTTEWTHASPHCSGCSQPLSTINRGCSVGGIVAVNINIAKYCKFGQGPKGQYQSAMTIRPTWRQWIPNCLLKPGNGWGQATMPLD